MLAGRKEKRDIPHEAGEWFEFQTLSGKQMEEAQAIERDRTLKQMRDMGQDLIQAMQGRSGATETPAPVDFYDKETLVRYGVVSWSYPERCDDDNKALLDAATRLWAATAIVEMNTRTPGEATGSSVNSNGVSSHTNSAEPIDLLKVR